MDLQKENPDDAPMPSMPPIPRDLMQLIAFIASLAAGYDAANQNKSETVLSLFGKSRTAAGNADQPHEKKPPH